MRVYETTECSRCRETRIVIEMTRDEAHEFYTSLFPGDDTFAKKVDVRLGKVLGPMKRDQ